MTRQPITLLYRRAVCLAPLMIAILLVVSCSSRLKRDSAKLHSGMTMEEVAKFFSQYEVFQSGTGDVANLELRTKLFQTNTACVFWVTYVPKNRSLFDFESCSVFFDAKKNIIGYEYELPD